VTRTGYEQRDVRGIARTVILLVALGAVPAVALVLAHRAAEARADEGEPVAATPVPSPGRVVTPLVSLRRAPTTVRNTLADDALVSSLAPLRDRIAPGSCLVVGIDGRPMFDDAGTTSVLPSSNMKLVTAAVALDVLGPDHRFSTEARTEVPPAPGGVIDGNLYLVGGGDPVLGTAAYVQAAAAQDHYPQPYVTSLEALADQMKAAGVTRIAGAVVGDDSRYDAERFVPSWPASYAAAREAGPLGALMVNDAAATLRPLRSAPDPAAHAAGVLTELLRERGITVGRRGARGATPPGATTLTSVQSRPLAELVGEMLTWSDDNTAELLLKEIGVAAGGGGSRPAGLAVVQSRLQSWGVPLDGINLVDGSGLDRGDRLTCAALLAVLAHAGPSGPLADGLPVAGRTGTLAADFHGNPAEGRLRAKTGTLTGSRALTGFVDAPDGVRHISFSYVQNGPRADVAAVPIWNTLGQVLTTYPTAPSTDALDPEPAAPPG
jgi:serine-type D-Ala-D-Ala carboxypeptidase/endopeptidase (penicillin-binding protein 4)